MATANELEGPAGEPRWEHRLLDFLEVSGVGRIVESGEDEEESRTACMMRG